MHVDLLFLEETTIRWSVEPKVEEKNTLKVLRRSQDRCKQTTCTMLLDLLTCTMLLDLLLMLPVSFQSKHSLYFPLANHFVDLLFHSRRSISVHRHYIAGTKNESVGATTNSNAEIQSLSKEVLLLLLLAA